ncbi:GlxA family transcriptional regulator [Cognatishimia sp. WU-CL00825]|uniref:GlxA family transcriptional regulator n=1 Tax=Cognatishimia sp. WU-CL00825 TaxID=3127658 RepID=UPI00310BAC6B
MTDSKTELTHTLAFTHHFDFLLVEGFSALSLASAIEALQNANLVADLNLYSWRIVAVKTGEVVASTGMRQSTEGDLSALSLVDDLVVVSGENAYNVDVSRLKVWLWKHVRSGVRLTALGTGSIILARTGLMTGHDAAIHPWYRVGFMEQFPETPLSSRTHISVGNRCSASGGTSSIDLFLDFIEEDHGASFANLVADSMCYRKTRLMQAAVDVGAPNSVSVLHPTVSRAISEMEKNLEFPASPNLLASKLNISTRQLERLFKKYIGQSPKKHYSRIRLEEAYRLLVQTHFEIAQIALMTGFTSPSHFSKCFRAQYDITPYELRRRPIDAGSRRF